MPKPHPPPLPKAATPVHSASFDPWNSSATGHQRPETHTGTGWRDSRSTKLNSQFRAGTSGGARIRDAWGPNAAGYSKELKGVVPAWARERTKTSVADMLKQPGLMRTRSGDAAAVKDDDGVATARENMPRANEQHHRRGIFHGTTIYVNGSTYPLISDHKLKHVLSENGANMSMHLGRRRVTHVILGRPTGGGQGAGGGLSGGKLDREIRTVGGCGVKYVGVEW